MLLQGFTAMLVKYIVVYLLSLIDNLMKGINRPAKPTKKQVQSVYMSIHVVRCVLMTFNRCDDQTLHGYR